MHELTPTEKLDIGKEVHITQSAFPKEEVPMRGYWIGKIVRSRQGGTGDHAIKIDGEPIFTRPKSEVVAWIVLAARLACRW